MRVSNRIIHPCDGIPSIVSSCALGTELDVERNGSNHPNPPQTRVCCKIYCLFKHNCKVSGLQEVISCSLHW